MEAPKETEKKEQYNPEEEVTADGNFKIIDLPTVEMGSGEETEEMLFACTVKLYRFESKEWQERAVGEFRFLKNKEDKRGRAILRQKTTNKLMANFYGKYSIFKRLHWIHFQRCSTF